MYDIWCICGTASSSFEYYLKLDPAEHISHPRHGFPDLELHAWRAFLPCFCRVCAAVNVGTKVESRVSARALRLVLRQWICRIQFPSADNRLQYPKRLQPSLVCPIHTPCNQIYFGSQEQNIVPTNLATQKSALLSLPFLHSCEYQKYLCKYLYKSVRFAMNYLLSHPHSTYLAPMLVRLPLSQVQSRPSGVGDELTTRMRVDPG
ncbi:uncharacterized protein BDR25DRAFT_352777 [Lindgomyces ingoldianus]|uniref:Uncharacterized protein n=1 Tax=Lindgomyces ingoldianus TaxID=673940 RepID=A0ACB6R2P1_9PLEO|nr:uncharacterized protein BDR25DRAFT_352777 [Lindgomyces ingoldianus]KAF2473370.1 hypothetical protein BDR25DRAFT_352777 [Lindgomyces ingoldianus]